MRSIGKVNKRKLLKIIQEEIDKQKDTRFFNGLDHEKLDMEIDLRIPDHWYDIWESAWSEIRRLIDDAITNYVHTKEVKF